MNQSDDRQTVVSGQKETRENGLNFVRRFSSDPHGGLAGVLTGRFLFLILWWTTEAFFPS